MSKMHFAGLTPNCLTNKAVELKRERNIKLADAVIAVTAIIYNLKLVTRNTDDFKAVSELEVF